MASIGLAAANEASNRVQNVLGATVSTEDKITHAKNRARIATLLAESNHQLSKQVSENSQILTTNARLPHQLTNANRYNKMAEIKASDKMSKNSTEAQNLYLENDTSLHENSLTSNIVGNMGGMIGLGIYAATRKLKDINPKFENALGDVKYDPVQNFGSRVAAFNGSELFNKFNAKFTGGGKKSDSPGFQGVRYQKAMSPNDDDTVELLKNLQANINRNRNNFSSDSPSPVVFTSEPKEAQYRGLITNWQRASARMNTLSKDSHIVAHRNRNKVAIDYDREKGSTPEAGGSGSALPPSNEEEEENVV